MKRIVLSIHLSRVSSEYHQNPCILIASDKIQRMMKFNHSLSNIKTKARFVQRYNWSRRNETHITVFNNRILQSIFKPDKLVRNF